MKSKFYFILLIFYVTVIEILSQSDNVKENFTVSTADPNVKPEAELRTAAHDSAHDIVSSTTGSSTSNLIATQSTHNTQDQTTALAKETDDKKTNAPSEKVERRDGEPVPILRKKKKMLVEYEVSSGSTSSSREMRDWKAEWGTEWLKKKYEKLKSSPPQGAVVNMAGAMPWGRPCGDPNQHDMPWGTCMLPVECEAEHRIYRGDYHCGRTEFVCCGFLLNTYDMDQADDRISLEDKDLYQDSQDVFNSRAADDFEERKRRRARSRRKRKLKRLKRKRKIRRKIRTILGEITRWINRMSKNHSAMREKKTKEIKKFITHLKKQYRNDRVSMQLIHDENMVKIDSQLLIKLNEVRDMNRKFVTNETFRDILVNGTVNKVQARMLVEAYPELYNYIPSQLRTEDMLRSKGSKDYRRLGRESGRRKLFQAPPEHTFDDYLEYDIEYGYLYY